MKTTTRAKLLKIMRDELNVTPPLSPRRHYKQ